MISLSQVSKIFYINQSFNQGIEDIKLIKRKPFYALKNINLEIGLGEFVVITGPNGAGKSTLLKIMAGRLKPSQGEVLVKSLPAYFIDLPPGHLLVKNYLLGKQINPDQSKYPDRLIRDLSLGMQARLMGDLISYQDRDIILLDDFFFATDREYQDLFFNNNRGKVIIVASQDPNSLKDYSTRIINLKNGKIVN